MDVYPRRSRSPAGRIDSYRSDDRDDDRGHYRRRSPGAFETLSCVRDQTADLLPLQQTAVAAE